MAFRYLKNHFTILQFVLPEALPPLLKTYIFKDRAKIRSYQEDFTGHDEAYPFFSRLTIEQVLVVLLFYAQICGRGEREFMTSCPKWRMN